MNGLGFLHVQLSELHICALQDPPQGPLRDPGAGWDGHGDDHSDDPPGVKKIVKEKNGGEEVYIIGKKLFVFQESSSLFKKAMLQVVTNSQKQLPG